MPFDLLQLGAKPLGGDGASTPVDLTAFGAKPLEPPIQQPPLAPIAPPPLPPIAQPTATPPLAPLDGMPTQEEWATLSPTDREFYQGKLADLGAAFDQRDAMRTAIAQQNAQEEAAWLNNSDNWGPMDWMKYHATLPMPMGSDVAGSAQLRPIYARINELVTGQPYKGEGGRSQDEVSQDLARMHGAGFTDPVQWVQSQERGVDFGNIVTRTAGAALRGVAEGIQHTASSLTGDQQSIRQTQAEQSWREGIEELRDADSWLPFAAKMVRRTGETAGRMATPLAGAAITGSAPAAYWLLGGQAGVDAFGQARAEGWSWPAAAAYGAVTGAIETASEMAGGKVSGHLGLETAEEAIAGMGRRTARKSVMSGIKNPRLRKVAEAMAGSALEGGEEVLADVLGTARDYAMGHENQANPLESFIVGMLYGGAMHGVKAAREFLFKPSHETAKAAGMQAAAQKQEDLEAVADAVSETIEQAPAESPIREDWAARTAELENEERALATDFYGDPMTAVEWATNNPSAARALAEKKNHASATLQSVDPDLPQLQGGLGDGSLRKQWKGVVAAIAADPTLADVYREENGWQRVEDDAEIPNHPAIQVKQLPGGTYVKVTGMPAAVQAPAAPAVTAAAIPGTIDPPGGTIAPVAETPPQSQSPAQNVPITGAPPAATLEEPPEPVAGPPSPAVAPTLAPPADGGMVEPPVEPKPTKQKPVRVKSEILPKGVKVGNKTIGIRQSDNGWVVYTTENGITTTMGGDPRAGGYSLDEAEAKYNQELAFAQQEVDADNRPTTDRQPVADISPEKPATPAARPTTDRQPTDRLTAAKLREQLNAAATSPEEADALYRLVEARAAAAGESVDDYVARRVKSVDLTTQDNSAAVQHGIATSPEGEMEFVGHGRVIIRAFLEAQQPITLAHELGHLFRLDLSPEDLAKVYRWAGIKDASRWDTKAEERFARGFEKYLRSGQSPTAALAPVFEHFKSWLAKLYEAIVGSPLGARLPAEIREIYDRMLVGKATKVAPAESPKVESAVEEQSNGDQNERRPRRTRPQDRDDLAPDPAESGEAAGTRGDSVRGDRGDRAGSGRNARSDVQEGDGPAGRAGNLDDGASEPAGRGDPGELAAPEPGGNYRITDADQIGQGGPKAKYRGNVEAIRLLKKLEAENRKATAEEQAMLAKYVGWGALINAFPSPSGKIAKGWNSEVAELRELLTDEEYAAAKKSTRNAHYTSPAVISAIWKGLEAAGFKGGVVSEPAMGAGHFYGLMPESLRDASQLHGIEMDSLTGRLAKQLYQGAKVVVAPFQEVRLPDDHFDLMISNVPFAKGRTTDTIDRDLGKLGASIHDYFFAKALKKTRPGGLVVFITSRYSLDKIDSGMRQYWADRADLVGAVRLPATAFKENAGTDVVTDVIVLQKRLPGATPAGQEFVDTKRVDVEGTSFAVNEYFVNHPEHVLGKLAKSGTMYADDSLNVEDDGRDVAGQLADALGGMTYGNMDLVAAATTAIEEAAIEANSSDGPDGGLVVKGGKLYRREGDDLVEQPIPFGERGKEKTLKRIEQASKLRDITRSLLAAQINESAGENFVTGLRKALNSEYDAFVKEYGPLNSARNVSILGGDDFAPLLRSLESWDEETKKAVKADIFEKRTQFPVKDIERADTAGEALTASLSLRGRVDLEWMRGIYPTESADKLIDELGELVYRTPDGRVDTAENYLSGNVRKKLAEAREAARQDKAYGRNVAALEKVQPEDVPFDKISPRLGVTWVSPKDYADFVEHLISKEVRFQYSAASGTWVLTNEGSPRLTEKERVDWGTDDYPTIRLLEAEMNHRHIQVTHRLSDGSTVVDKEASAAARAKRDELVREFDKWLWSEPARAERLSRVYNDNFNNIRLPEYNGSHLAFPGMSAAVKLRPHQANAIWRILSTGNTLLAHVVGAGKTYTMQAAAMEMRRLGLAKKPMFVIPNHLIQQFPSEFLQLYPGARLLAATPDDFTPANRRRLMNRIMTGDWDAIIVPQTSFEKVPVSPARMKAFFDAQIADLEKEIHEAKAEKGTDNRNYLKELENAKDNLEAKLKELSADWKKDAGPYFDELGVDALFVDEAHGYKNLWFRTRMGRVPGVQPQFVQKTFDMLQKTEFINEVTKGRGVVFATGTPVANSVTELFTMQRYLQPQALTERGIEAFDAWASTFGREVTDVEVTPEGGGFRVHTRFRQFVNLPELQQVFRSVADVMMAEKLNLPRPKIKGGKAQVVQGPTTPELEGIVKELVARAEAIRGGQVDPRDDNMLAVTNDGRSAAVDLRLFDPSLPDFPDSKLNQAVENVFGIWKRTAAKRSTQIIWLDRGIPSDKTKAGQAVDLYADIKQKLIAMGVPPSDIAFIHDAKNDKQRATLFKKMRSGQVRIMIANTERMATGANVQKRLFAAHHLDAPWRPADVEQRDGRIVRQGNENDEVEIYRYVTKGSFDAYMWQTLEMKAQAISQLMDGDGMAREMEDVGGAALEYAEIKAIAARDPRIMRFTKLRAEVSQLEAERGAYNSQQVRLRMELSGQADIERSSKVKAKNLATYADKAIVREGGEFDIKIGGKSFERKDAAEPLQKAIDGIKVDAEPESIGEFSSFPLLASRVHNWASEQKGATVVKATLVGPDIHFELGEDGVGNLLRIANQIKKIPDLVPHYEQEAEKAALRQKSIAERVGKPFAKQAELDEKSKELSQLQADLSKPSSNEPGDDRSEVSDDSKPPRKPREGSGGGESATADSRKRPRDRGAGDQKFTSQSAKPAGSATKPGVTELRGVPVPEMLQLAKELLGGKLPIIRKMHQAWGRFSGIEGARSSRNILLNPRVAKDEYQLASTFAHEIGHLIDFLPDATLKRGNILGRIASITKFLRGFLQGVGNNKVIRGELIELTKWWSGDYTQHNLPSYTKHRESARELYAEAVSVFINNPGELEARAPQFWGAFTAHLNAKSEVLADYLTVQELLNGTPDELAADRAERIRQMFEKGDQAIKAGMNAREEANRSSWESTKQALEQYLIDRAAPIRSRMAKARAQGATFDDAENAYYILDELNYADSENHDMLARVEREFYQPVMAQGFTRGDIDEYLFLRRIVNERNEIINPLGFTPSAAAEQLSSLQKRLGPERFRRLEGAMGIWHDILFESVERAVDAGVYNRDRFNTTIKPNKDNYATFAVTHYLENDAHISAGIFQQVGTFSDIASPLDATHLKTITLNRLTALNIAKSAVRKFLEQNFPQEIAEVPIPYGEREPSKAPRQGMEYIIELIDGKPHAYEVPKAIAKSFLKSDIGSLSKVASLMQSEVYGTFHPLFVTFSPGFQSQNPSRDLRRTHLNLSAIGNKLYRAEYDRLTGQGWKPAEAKAMLRKEKITLAQIMRAYWDAKGPAWRRAAGIQDETIDKLMREKVLDIPFVKIDPEMIENEGATKHLLAQHGLVTGEDGQPPAALWRLLNTIVGPIVSRIPYIPGKVKQIAEAVEAVGVFQETLPKVAAYKMLASRRTQPRERSFMVRKYAGTPDFKQRGLWTMATNGVLMYSKVRANGLEWDMDLATSKDTAASWWWRRMLWTIMPTTATKAAVYGVFGPAAAGFMAAIPKYFLDTYDVIPIGWLAGDDDDEDRGKAMFVTVAQDDTGRFLKTILSHLLDIGARQAGKDTRNSSTGELVTQVFGDVLDSTIGSLNPMLDLAWKWSQFAAGQNPRDSHFDSDIIPPTEWKAGGIDATKKMLAWTFDKFGVVSTITHALTGKAVGNAFESGEETTIETATRSIPGLEKLLRVSDRGYSESQWADMEAEEQERAAFKLSLPKEARDATKMLYRLQRRVDPLSDKEADQKAMLQKWYNDSYVPITQDLQKPGADQKELRKQLGESAKDLEGNYLDDVAEDRARIAILSAGTPTRADGESLELFNARVKESEETRANAMAWLEKNKGKPEVRKGIDRVINSKSFRGLFPPRSGQFEGVTARQRIQKLRRALDARAKLTGQ